MHDRRHALLAKLAASRQELLDLGLRNPLLHFRLSPARGVQVVDERPDDVFDLLVRQGKAMTFAPAPEATKQTVATPPVPPTEAQREPQETEREQQYTDTKLQTPDPLAKLEKRLLNTYYTARTSLEEQGVNILYLALGQLEWYETDQSAECRRAPLVLVPVELARTSARDRFRLRHTGADVEGNLSLQAKLKAEFGLDLPPLPDWEEPITLNQYFGKVARLVLPLNRWRVDREAIVLGFFSFGKFMLYRDLDLQTWPEETNVLEHPVLEALLETGFQEPRPSVPEDAFLDTDTESHALHQVVDADSSQLLAMLAVQEGRNLVIQGPPGTGKSQTITNLVAEAIGAGKRVLFVAEKMAALEVVKRRLDSIGLGAACLELHSHKANKKALHDELKRTLELNRPVLHHLEQEVALLDRHRQELNGYCAAVNDPIGQSGLSAQEVMGELLILNAIKGEVALPRLALRYLPAWTATDMQRLEAIADRLEALLQRIGRPKDLVFWGSGLQQLLPADRDQLTGLLQEAQASVAELQDRAERLAHTLNLPLPGDRPAAEALLSPSRQVLLAPTLTGTEITDPAWHDRRHDLRALLEAGKNLAELKARREELLLSEAWGQDVLDIRTQLLAYGDKWWRFVVPDYHRATKRLQGLASQSLPNDQTVQLALVDDILAANRHAQTLRDSEAFATSLFKSHWQGERSDWNHLREVYNYLQPLHEAIREKRQPATLLPFLASDPDLEAFRFQLTALEEALATHHATIRQLTQALRLDEVLQFGSEGRLLQQPFLQEQKVLQRWTAGLPELPFAIDWNNQTAAARQEGLEELVTLAESWPPAPTLLRAVLRQNWLEYLLGEAYRDREPLRTFERTGHEEVIHKFREADRKKLQHNRARAALAHWEQVPRFAAGGQLGILKLEFNKKARHLPVRRLMEQAGLAIQAIKPVFMMSPLSIANYLPPGALDFDLVIFDEASQVKPVDALGAILRGRQLVVVGDSKQLPPTSFFDAITGNPAAEDEDNVTADMQSILGLCEARQAPQRMLRWHYRSLHDSLIRLSNHEFYENRLVIFPSPGHLEQLGLMFHHLPQTVYERGTTRANPKEAQAVAQAVMAHARQYPHLTLGVAAFSTAQRQAVEEALEQLRKASPATEAFFTGHPHEPFFIKNLENVQGDERDVIFISIGYGRTADGTLPMNFGPLNADGGERRLNVLITRAKRRCEVFCNFTAADLDLSRSQARGVAALQSFLYFAQHGRLPVAATPDLEPEAPFEESLHRALTGLGYTVQRQVGSEGYHLDLAIADPAQPGRYLLGIECDGRMYRNARSARDRDRLRQQVLSAIGWKLHRVWSTDWFTNPQRELKRLVQAITEAAGGGQPTAPGTPPPAGAAPGQAGELLREEGSAQAAQTLPPYQVAQLPKAVAAKELHQHNLNQLAVWVTEIVRVEGPVHFTEMARRLAEAAGATRVGNRIRESLEQAVRLAGHKGAVRQEGEFLWPATLQTPPLRDRSTLPAASRKLHLIAPEELALAVQEVVSRSFAIARPEVPAQVLRVLGFTRMSEEMRVVVEEVVEALVGSGVLVEGNGGLRVG